MKTIDDLKLRAPLIDRASDELLAEVIEMPDLMIWGDHN
jgi:hypothetical protein